MKIEKITENKIRIIIKPEDFKDKNIDIREVLKKSTTSQTLFTEILDYAKKEIGFDTDGYKVQIEGFSSLDDVFVFTIHRDHGVMPYGYDKTSDTDKYQELDRDTLLNSPRYGCRNDKENTSTNGAYCFGLIFFDNWEIKDDYPW